MNRILLAEAANDVSKAIANLPQQTDCDGCAMVGDAVEELAEAIKKVLAYLQHGG